MIVKLPNYLFAKTDRNQPDQLYGISLRTVETSNDLPNYSIIIKKYLHYNTNKKYRFK